MQLIIEGILLAIGCITVVFIFIGLFSPDPDKKRRSQIRRIMAQRNRKGKGPLNLK